MAFAMACKSGSHWWTFPVPASSAWAGSPSSAWTLSSALHPEQTFAPSAFRLGAQGPVSGAGSIFRTRPVADMRMPTNLDA